MTDRADAKPPIPMSTHGRPWWPGRTAELRGEIVRGGTSRDPCRPTIRVDRDVVQPAQVDDDAVRCTTATPHGPPSTESIWDVRSGYMTIAPGLYADAAIHYDTRERAISDFVSKRVGRPTDSLCPLDVGRATLATCRAAYDRCVARDDTRPLLPQDAALAAGAGHGKRARHVVVTGAGPTSCAGAELSTLEAAADGNAKPANAEQDGDSGEQRQDDFTCQSRPESGDDRLTQHCECRSFAADVVVC